MDLSQVWTLLVAHAWIPVAVLVVGYLVRLTADDTKFPVTIAPQWHPVIAIGLADLLILLKAWPDWRAALNPAMLIALGALIGKAYYANKPEPAWLVWLAAVVPMPESITAHVTRVAQDGQPQAVTVRATGEATVQRLTESIRPVAAEVAASTPIDVK